jgi:hypothetical protein
MRPSVRPVLAPGAALVALLGLVAVAALLVVAHVTGDASVAPRTGDHGSDLPIARPLVGLFTASRGVAQPRPELPGTARQAVLLGAALALGGLLLLSWGGTRLPVTVQPVTRLRTDRRLRAPPR